MISTVNIISDLRDVSKQWVFEHYLNLYENLIGQNVKISSVFNSADKTPSMWVYYDDKSNQYRFKDFSTGEGGDHIELVKVLFSLNSRGDAVFKIMTDYENYLKNSDLNNNSLQNKLNIVKQDRFKVTDYEIRFWNTIDFNYWKQYKISSFNLGHYEIKPLSFFNMEKKDLNGNIIKYEFNRNKLYGYFTKNGDLYKIYMPDNTAKKFIKIKNYLQGFEQLTYSTKYLIITSSLKDLICFNNLNIQNIESIAPDSENSMINEVQMKQLLLKYSKIIVLFDNDIPGVKAAKQYKSKYNIDYIILPLEKDLSDSIKVHTEHTVKLQLFQLLKNVI